MHRMDQLQLKCVHDDLDQSSVMPCTRDCQKLFIEKIREDIKKEAHEMLITRHAHTLIQADLTYANCKFEGMYHHHMMALFSTVETIILQRKAIRVPEPGHNPSSCLHSESSVGHQQVAAASRGRRQARRQLMAAKGEDCRGASQRHDS